MAGLDRVIPPDVLGANEGLMARHMRWFPRRISVMKSEYLVFGLQVRAAVILMMPIGRRGVSAGLGSTTDRTAIK
jgi:hypothetical protein